MVGTGGSIAARMTPWKLSSARSTPSSQRNEAGRVAAAWLNLEVSTQALASARRVRERGKGRPSAQALELLAGVPGLQTRAMPRPWPTCGSWPGGMANPLAPVKEILGGGR